jgi:lysylphosphatidylglycerol synthetase-like protein (DUF2156 family)
MPVSGRAMALAIVVLGAFYGACMGSFNVLTGQPFAWLQILSSAIKVPTLFLLTIVVTFPSLYVFNTLVGSRLTLTNMLRLILAATGVMLAVLAGFGTIVAFFNFTSSSYAFILLLNVVVFTVAGVLGLGFLLQTLRRLVEPDSPPPPPPQPPQPMPSSVAPAIEAEPVGPDQPGSASRSYPASMVGPLTRIQQRPASTGVRAIFRIWIVVFALVGAQMSWVLRPFVGSYGDGEFVWFRPRSGNFFERVWDALLELLGVAQHLS